MISSYQKHLFVALADALPGGQIASEVFWGAVIAFMNAQLLALVHSSTCVLLVQEKEMLSCQIAKKVILVYPEHK